MLKRERDTPQWDDHMNGWYVSYLYLSKCFFLEPTWLFFIFSLWHHQVLSKGLLHLFNGQTCLPETSIIVCKKGLHEIVSRWCHLLSQLNLHVLVPHSGYRYPQDWACSSYKGWPVPWGGSSQVISRTWSGKEILDQYYAWSTNGQAHSPHQLRWPILCMV